MHNSGLNTLNSTSFPVTTNSSNMAALSNVPLSQAPTLYPRVNASPTSIQTSSWSHSQNVASAVTPLTTLPQISSQADVLGRLDVSEFTYVQYQARDGNWIHKNRPDTNDLYWCAQQGDPSAQLVLAQKLLKANEGSKTDALAIEWLMQSAGQGNRLAEACLGELYEKGVAVDKDLSKAVAYYASAGNRGCAQSNHALGNLYAQAGNCSHAAQWFGEAAKMGHAPSQYRLGLLFINGLGVAPDPAKAFDLVCKAAEQGNADAQHRLGAMYANGSGVACSEYDAASWYGKAANNGHALAARDLGRAYQKGFGVGVDLEMAQQWLAKACERGAPDAEFDLGMLYAGSILTNAHAGNAAVYWFEKAAAKGSSAASWNLSLLYQAGVGGIPQDPARATLHMGKAAELGHPDAMLALGIAYRDGKGLAQDSGQAYRWLTAAHNRGAKGAAFALGNLLEGAMQTRPTAQEAIDWYGLAAQNGDAQAQFRLGMVYASGGMNYRPDLNRAAQYFEQAARNGVPDAARMLQFAKDALRKSGGFNT